MTFSLFPVAWFPTYIAAHLHSPLIRRGGHDISACPLFVPALLAFVVAHILQTLAAPHPPSLPGLVSRAYLLIIYLCYSASLLVGTTTI